jgi:hypothetical protein
METMVGGGSTLCGADSAAATSVAGKDTVVASTFGAAVNMTTRVSIGTGVSWIAVVAAADGGVSWTVTVAGAGAAIS